MTGRRRSKFQPRPILELPFVADTTKRLPDGSRRNLWAVIPSGDYRKDWDTKIDYALQYMAWQNTECQKDPDYPNSAGLILHAIIDSGDKSGVTLGFKTTIVDTSVWSWNPARLAQVKQFYAERRAEGDAILEKKNRRRRA